MTGAHLVYPRPGSVQTKAGTPCPAAEATDYPLYAVCNVCDEVVICADSTATWTHRDPPTRTIKRQRPV